MAEDAHVTHLRVRLGRSLASRRRLAGLTQAQLAPITIYGRSTVANVEVGRQNVGRAFWSRCDETLAADGALLAEFDLLEAARLADGSLGLPTFSMTWPGTSTAGAEPGTVERELLGMLAAVAVGVVPDRDPRLTPWLTGDGPWPDRVDEVHVEAVRDITQVHRRFQYSNGGPACRAAAVAYLSWAEGLTRRPAANEPIRLLLLAALAELHNVVGWTEHDSAADGRARRHFARACLLAADAGHRPVMADSYYRLGRVSLAASRPVEALRFFQLGQIVAQDAGCLASLAILHANEAWAYALLDEPGRVTDSLARAGSELARVDFGRVPTHARFITAPADLHGVSAAIHGVLAAHPGRAAHADLVLTHAEAAVAARRPGEERSLAFDLISTANGHLLARDYAAAEAAAERATDAAQALATARVTGRLVDWCQLARSVGAPPTLDGVAERILHLPSA